MTVTLYQWFILIALIGEFSVNAISGLLNLRAMKAGIPEEMRDTVDHETYTTAQRYARDRLRLENLSNLFELGLFLLFWSLGGFAVLDRFISTFALSPVVSGMVFVGSLVIAGHLLQLPFSYYGTFVIEERYGFNRSTRRTFLLDRIKGLLFLGLFGGMVLAGVFQLFRVSGSDAWWHAWMAVTLFFLFMQYITPTWIMPWFLSFEPLPDGELKEAILRYSSSSGYPLSGIYQVDGSRRSGKANAFFTGFGKNRRVALFDTLIQKHDTAEIVAVLAHEVGHFKHRHILKRMVLSIVHLGVLLFLFQLFVTDADLAAAFGMERTTLHGGLVFFGLLMTPLNMLLSPAMHALSRRYEFQADNFAAKTVNDPESLARALKKLSRDTLSNLTPHPIYVTLNYSHPPVTERIRAIRAAVAPEAVPKGHGS
ncbi:MAG: M48 family metallopeptidase [Magnetococcales bacterium]|nr:M48 family metallopeptidase [Magnetococcales bacterium]